MRAYVARRLLLMIPTCILASVILFLAIRLVPGSVIDLMAANLGTYSPIDKAEMMRRLGLDVPIAVQYGRWVGILPQQNGKLNGILQGNLGESLWQQTSVLRLVQDRWPVTLELGVLALIIAQVIALPVGIYSALRQDTWGDYIARSLAIICIAIPPFWLGTMVIVFPSIWWGYMPSIILIPFREDPIGNLKMFLVPAIVLGLSLSGTETRITRTMMLEVLRQEYIRTAWAKGLGERAVVLWHALRNGLIPIITVIGLQMPIVFGGTVIIENIFSLPGMGRLLVNATTTRDYPVVSGVMLIMAVVVMLNNLLIDLIYGFIDPRIRNT